MIFRKAKRKISVALMMFFLGALTLAPLSVQAGDGDGERVLRKGHCWLDGTPNCRKKKNGIECDLEKHCSLKAYLGIVVAAITVADKLK